VRPSRLGPGAEFDLIRDALARAPAVVHPDLVLGPGDDAALVRAREGDLLAVTGDLAVEDVHFRLDWIDVADAAARAVRAALSDLAAVAAEPVGVYLAVAAPAGAAAERTRAALVAAGETAAAFGAAWLGGDIARGGRGWAFDVVALGHVERPLLRSGVRPGDEIWVSGPLGGAAAAVRAWRAGGEPEPRARERFVRPVPRIAEARWLARHELACAAIDVSDGLVADAGHLAAASGVRIEIDATAVPVHPAATLAEALAGGEDYELLWAGPPDAASAALDAFRTTFGLAPRRVGRAAVGAGVRVYGPEGALSLATRGHDHFAEP
jgi:thiamine-monophosphate kinase